MTASTLNDLAAMWADAPDFTDDVSNDYRERSIAARNARQVNPLAECGHCGRILDPRKRTAARHVAKCERENRPYAFGAN